MTQFAGKGVAGEPTGLVAVASGIASIMPPPPHFQISVYTCMPSDTIWHLKIKIKNQRGQADSGYRYYLLIVGNNKKPTKHEDLHFAV